MQSKICFELGLSSNFCLSFRPPQQISQHQELFIQMLNEPAGEGGDVPEVGELGAANIKK